MAAKPRPKENSRNTCETATCRRFSTSVKRYYATGGKVVWLCPRCIVRIEHDRKRAAEKAGVFLRPAYWLEDRVIAPLVNRSLSGAFRIQGLTFFNPFASVEAREAAQQAAAEWRRMEKERAMNLGEIGSFGDLRDMERDFDE